MGSASAAISRGGSIVAIWVLQCLAMYRLYDTSVGDLVRFALPGLVGFVLFYVSLWVRLPGRPRPSPTLSMLFAMLLEFCVFWMGMFICLYAFGV